MPSSRQDREERGDRTVAGAGRRHHLLAVAQLHVEAGLAGHVARGAGRVQLEAAPLVLGALDRRRQVLVLEDRPELLARHLAALRRRCVPAPRR